MHITQHRGQRAAASVDTDGSSPGFSFPKGAGCLSCGDREQLLLKIKQRDKGALGDRGA